MTSPKRLFSPADTIWLPDSKFISLYTWSSTKQGSDSSLPAYLKKPFSDIQYAEPSTSTHAFCPTNPQFVPTCEKANVNGDPTNLCVNKAVSVQT